MTGPEPSAVGSGGPRSAMAELSRRRLLSIFRTLVLSRAVGEGLRALGVPVLAPAYASGWRLADPVLEAGIVAAASALRSPGDRISGDKGRSDSSVDLALQSVRSPGVCLLRGHTPESIFLEARLRFRRSPGRGVARDFRGQADSGDIALGLLGPVPPVRSLVDVGAGLAMAMSRRGDEGVVMVLCGDGSPATGAWHEGVNFAAVRRVPLVVVVPWDPEAAGDASRRYTRLESFMGMCPGYGIEGTAVEMSRVPDVNEAARTLVARARAGQGTQLLELRRPERPPPDPLFLLRETLLEGNHATADELDELVTVMHREAEEAGTRVLEERGT